MIFFILHPYIKKKDTLFPITLLATEKSLQFSIGISYLHVYLIFDYFNL